MFASQPTIKEDTGGKENKQEKEIKRMERICGNCVLCLIGIDGERLCSLASNEYATKDEDDQWIAGRLVAPEDECIYPENSDYLSFRPVEPMVNMALAHPGWCRKPNSCVLLEAQEAVQVAKEYRDRR